MENNNRTRGTVQIEDTPKGPQAIEVFEISQEETGVDVAMGDTEEAEDTIEDVFESDMEEVEDTIEDVFELDMEEIEPAETFL